MSCTLLGFICSLIFCIVFADPISFEEAVFLLLYKRNATGFRVQFGGFL